MRIKDVINQIRNVLPQYTDYFSVQKDIETLVVTPTKATFTFTAPHGLTTGDSITISGVEAKTFISGVSKDGLVFTFETSTPHDLTLKWHENITLDGFTNIAWNNSFTLKAVPNRKTFKIQSAEALPILIGNENLLENRLDGINGRWKITVIDPTSFEISGNFLETIYVGGKISSGVRISGSVDIARSIEQYTIQKDNDFWMFLIPHSADVSKDRNALSDATATRTASDNMHLRIIDGFSIFIIKNTSQDIAALDAVDICRHNLLLPLLKSVYGVRFETGLTGAPDFRTILTGHAMFAYNKAIITYVYDFEVPMDLTNSDAAEKVDTVAFRNIEYEHEIGDQNTENLTANINLDEEPL